MQHAQRAQRRHDRRAYHTPSAFGRYACVSLCLRLVVGGWFVWRICVRVGSHICLDICHPLGCTRQASSGGFCSVCLYTHTLVQVKMREACAAWTYTSTQASHNAETLRRPRFLVFFSSDLLFPGSVFRAPAASGSRGRLPVIHSILSVMHSILSSALHERVRTPSARTARLFRFCKCGLRSFPAFRARGGWTRDGRGAA